MAAADILPRVILPEGVTDIAKIEIACRLNSDAKETKALLFQGLQDIERGHDLLILGGSLDYECLLTKHGRISLHGVIYSWMLATEKVALATLWERFPHLRDYLRSRTEYFIAAKQRDLEILGDPDGYVTTKLQALEDELELVI